MTHLNAVKVKFVFSIFFFAGFLFSAAQSKMSFTITMEQPATHTYHVTFTCSGIKEASLDLKMPAWTPGYYQLLNYAKNADNFKVTDTDGKPVNWVKSNANTWQVITKNISSIVVSYDVKATVAFVAQSFLDETHGYIIPAGVCLYVANKINHPATVTIVPYKGWANVATGLDSVPGKKFTYTAPDFDVLFDSPILIGNLEALPEFKVKGITHRFIGYQLGNFNKEEFINDLKKIVEGGAAIIGDIPYKQYTFLAIGPGRGGIEHLNSTTISFDGTQLNSTEGKVRMLSFIAHEYFHHYNVKRIRPVELGPFDYDNGNRTKMLWVSEGLTVYYEYLILKRAGLMTQQELFNAFRSNLSAYENKPGHLYQSVAQASYETWSDGPFGRTGDEINKTISYYDKGPVLGMLLDFKIRHETKNKKSLDDVMRMLYQKFYQQKKRGFTEAEFKSTCEAIAGCSLDEFFEYVYTVKEVNYPQYLAYAGLTIDTSRTPLPGAWLGINARDRKDSLMITAVDWNSPAWNAGIHAQDKILEADGKKVSKKLFDEWMASKTTGDKIKLLVQHDGTNLEKEIILTKKMEKPFTITPVADADTLQKVILKTWMNE